MAEKSLIEWTDATWNPVTGCTKISAGCDNCYAERLSERLRGTPGHPFENCFDLTLRPDRRIEPRRHRLGDRRWRKRPPRAPDGARMGEVDPRAVQGSSGCVLLQAMGRLAAEVRWAKVGRAGVE